MVPAERVGPPESERGAASVAACHTSHHCDGFGDLASGAEKRRRAEEESNGGSGRLECLCISERVRHSADGQTSS